MGQIQNSVNQINASLAGLALGAKHIQKQTQANDLANKALANELDKQLNDLDQQDLELNKVEEAQSAGEQDIREKSDLLDKEQEEFNQTYQGYKQDTNGRWRDPKGKFGKNLTKMQNDMDMRRVALENANKDLQSEIAITRLQREGISAQFDAVYAKQRALGGNK